ncbi:hypothetical protein GJAV_G00207790 [Gymnothorax javanicus]|nr:hypothetical protein GJAV_G00207790 [Gymnothorax javanicus]
MGPSMEAADIVVVVFYFLLVLSVGLFAMRKSNRGTVRGYFLAGRSMNWVVIGASLFVSNIGSQHFIGMAGSGAAIGYAVGAFEFSAVLVLQLLGWVFIPVYIYSGVYTMPDYLSKRYGGNRLKMYFAGLTLLLYIFTKLSVGLYSGALFIKESLGWNLYLSIILLITMTALLTVTGGLAAVIYTDTLQALLMTIGAFILTAMSLAKIQPKAQALKVLRGPLDMDIPWPGFLLGHCLSSVWYWCADQVIVQRVLAAKNIAHAKGSTLMAGVLKILPMFIILIPGMIARILFPDELACVGPEHCVQVCGSRAGCSNMAYPRLVMSLMPVGLRGFMMAVIIAALMSDLDSVFNSASTIFTLDLYQALRRSPSPRELMVVGRIFVVVMVAVSIAWVPFIIEDSGGQMYIYIQEVSRLPDPARRCNLPAGCTLHMYVAAGLFWTSILVVVLVSICTPAPSAEQVCSTTLWGLRHKGQKPMEDPEGESYMLSDKVADHCEGSCGPHKSLPPGALRDNRDGHHADITLLVCPADQPESPTTADHAHLHFPPNYNATKRDKERGMGQKLLDWFCGYKEEPSEITPPTGVPPSTPQEEDCQLVLEMLDEPPKIKLVLNLGLLVVCCLGCQFVLLSEGVVDSMISPRSSTDMVARMEPSMEAADIVVVVLYFLLVLSVGLFAMRKSNRGTVQGYFLAGRSMNWVMIGASLYVSNIGSEHFIGLAGSGAAIGYGVGALEFCALLILQLLGWVFIPVYIYSGVYTMPDYLSKRYGGHRLKMYFAALTLLLYIFTKLSVGLYSAALFIQESLGWNLYLSIILLITMTALLTVTGGLAAVIYTDTLQALLMIIGALILAAISLAKVGGLEGVQTKYMQATPNLTAILASGNFTHPSTCPIQPKAQALKALRDPLDEDFPWPGFLLGQTPSSIWYWCADQVIVQRVLAAKNIAHAKGSTLMAGFLKILPMFIIVIPGMIARILFPDELACVGPEHCVQVCGSRAGCSNIAYPRLVMSLMPVGLRGLMMAVIIAALMSDLDSIFNSASTIFTLDVYRAVRRCPSPRELMVVGRLFVVVMVATSIAWVPVIIEMQGGQMYMYIQEVAGYLTPPAAAIFLLGIFWKRCNEMGAFWGAVAGFVLGFTRLVLAFVYPEPPCDIPDDRPAFISKIHFMYVAAGLFWASVLVAVLVSLCTQPPIEEQVRSTTLWGLRHKGQKPMRDPEGESHALNDKVADHSNSFSGPHKPTPPGALRDSGAGQADIALLISPTSQPESLAPPGTHSNDHAQLRVPTNDGGTERERGRCKKLLDWFCGYKEVPIEIVPPAGGPSRSPQEEDRQLILEMLHEPSTIRLVLNLSLLVVLFLGVFMLISPCSSPDVGISIDEFSLTSLKALQSNLKFSLLPKRLIICKRLAQCLHPALPSGVHLKALETYEVIFKIIGTKWLAKDLFIYRQHDDLSGLFPLLGHAPMTVRPVVLKLYERYFLPLQRALLPSLQAFVMGLLPGLEEGLEVYDRTDALMVKLSLLLGQSLFYSALWNSVLISPLLRLPATSFIVLHFDRMGSGHEQRYMLGSNHALAMQAIYLALQDSNVLVQRNTLEILLFFLPLCSCQDPAKACVPVTLDDVVSIMSAASLTLLRRDLSLNRRLYAWLLGTDCKGGMVAPEPNISTSLESHAAFYFDKYSRDLLIQALILILEQKRTLTDPESVQDYLRPLRIITILLEKPEIGTQVADHLMLEVIRALYRCCCGPLCENQQGTRENKNMAEVIKTINVLISSLGPEYLWDYMSGQFHTCLSVADSGDPSVPVLTDGGSPPPRAPPSLSELSGLISFLLDVIPLELYPEIQTHYLPQMLVKMLRALQSHMTILSLSELTQGLNACLKVLTMIQTPVACSAKTTEPQTQGDKESLASSGVEKQEVEEQEGTKEEKEEEEEGEENDLATEDLLETAKLTRENEQEEQEVQEEQREEQQEEQQEQEVQQEEQQEVRQEVQQEEQQEVQQVLKGECAALTPPPLAEQAETDLELAPYEPTPTAPEEEHEPPPMIEDVWRRGGSMGIMTKCVKDILASFIARHLLCVVGEEQDAMADGKAEPPSGQEEGSQETSPSPQTPETGPGGPAPDKQTEEDVASASGVEESCGAAGRLDWWEALKISEETGIPESCIQAFSAVCHLLLECSTFPLHLSEEELEGLSTCVSHCPGNVEDTLPLWLMSLMMCCLLKDHHVQQVALSTMLELVNRSQSLNLGIKDKNRRFKSSGSNFSCGQLFMVTAPPLSPTVLAVIAQSTDFYQRVALMLWQQLDTEQKELHVPSVDLLYRLHCLAPSANVCEGIICQELMHKDKTVRLEALHRFSVLWHLTRETQTNVTMLLNRSFDRSLFAVLDNLNNPDGSISATTQNWLIRALSLNDVIRILEPILLLLLHPTTQSSSIQWVKQNLTVDNLQQLSCREGEFSGEVGRPAEAMATEDQFEESPLSHVTPVDRAALWAEMESAPVTAKMESPVDKEIKGTGQEKEVVEGEQERHEEIEERSQEEGEEEDEEEEEEEREVKEHSDLAESSCSSNSMSPLSLQDCDISEGETLPSELRRDSAPTLGSEEEDLEQDAMVHLHLLEQEKEEREVLESLFRHTLLYLQPHDSAPMCHALSAVELLLRSCPAPFLQALCSAHILPNSAHHRLICTLMQRHQAAQEGHSFYGPLPAPAVRLRPVLLVELLISLSLRFLRSFYPCYLRVEPLQLCCGHELQLKSAEVLVLLATQLVSATWDLGGVGRMRELVWGLLSRCRVQGHALLALCASMHITQRPEGAGPPGEGLLEEGGGVLEENLLNLDGSQMRSEHALQVELLKLLQVLIVLEKQVWMGGTGGGAPSVQGGTSPQGWEWQEVVLFQQSAHSVQYVQTRPLPAQAMFVSAAARALQPLYGYTLHTHWVAFISASLPYLGPSLAAISAPFITQICRNLDDLVQQHQCPLDTARCGLKMDNMAPDYPLTLLEGLTIITHYCLLLHSRKSLHSPAASSPADIQSAREAVLSELPRMLVTMVMLWGVVQREEAQPRALDSTYGPECTLGCRRTSSTSVYFRSIKILRKKVLEFLNPLVAQFGVQVMASVGAVWGEPRVQGSHDQSKILPAADEFHETVVGLIKSLSMLSTNTILQLVREVLRMKPHQAKGDQIFSQALPLLHFTYTFIQGVPAESLQDCISPLLSLLKESVQLSLNPLGYFLLLGILNDFVIRFPNLDNKKDSRDVQEVTQRVLEVVGGVAGSSLQQTSWLSRTLEVRTQPSKQDHVHLHDSETPAEASASSYSIQALALLAEVLAPLLDVVFRSDEKERALPLISRLLEYVFPYLKNHSVYNMPSFCASARLLQGLSDYAYTKRAWRREAFDLYMDPQFFNMDPCCITHWGSIIDHLLTYEKTLFKDLTSMQTSALKLSPNNEQKAALLKRQAFAMISGELDQYCLYLPLIQERVTESLRVGQAPSVVSQIFLLFRVLLLRVSPQHLTSLWTVMVTELIHVFVNLEKTLLEGQEVSRNCGKGRGSPGSQERNGPVALFSRCELEMYLSACKFLDAMLCFPPERIPLFQMYRWAFVPEVDLDSYSGPQNSVMEGELDCQPHVVLVLDGLRYRYKELNGTGEHSCPEKLELPLLPQHSISCITQLEPFFRALSTIPKGPQSMADYVSPDSNKILSKLEEMVQSDFLESMDN